MTHRAVNDVLAADSFILEGNPVQVDHRKVLFHYTAPSYFAVFLFFAFYQAEAILRLFWCVCLLRMRYVACET